MAVVKRLRLQAIAVSFEPDAKSIHKKFVGIFYGGTHLYENRSMTR